MFCSRLHRRKLAGIHRAAPDDAAAEPLARPGRIHQLGHKLIVRLVVRQSGVEPSRDLASASVDEARAAIIVAKKIVPERQPMVGIATFVGQELCHKLGTLIR